MNPETTIREHATLNRIALRDILGKTRLPHIVRCRREIAKLLVDDHDMNSTEIAALMGRDRTTVHHWLGMTARSRRSRPWL